MKRPLLQLILATALAFLTLTACDPDGRGRGDENNTERPDGSSNDGSSNNGSSNDTEISRGLYCHFTFDGNLDNRISSGPEAGGYGYYFVEGLNGTQGLDLRASTLNFDEAIIDGGTYTISFWVKKLSHSIIYNVESNNQWGKGFILEYKPSGLLYCSDGYDYNYKPAYFDHPSLDPNAWTHIAITSNYVSGIEDCTVKLYLNGQYISSIQEEMVGYQNVNYGIGFRFRGNMIVDNLRIYSEDDLDSKTIKKIYEAERPQ